MSMTTNVWIEPRELLLMLLRAMAGVATALGTMNILNSLSSSAYLQAMLGAVPFGTLVANMIVAILMLLLSGLVGGGTVRLLGNRNGYLFAGAIGLAIAVYTLLGLDRCQTTRSHFEGHTIRDRHNNRQSRCRVGNTLDGCATRSPKANELNWNSRILGTDTELGAEVTPDPSLPTATLQFTLTMHERAGRNRHKSGGAQYRSPFGRRNRRRTPDPRFALARWVACRNCPGARLRGQHDRHDT